MGEYADDIIDQIIDYNIDGVFTYKSPRKKSFQSGSGDFNWRTRNGVLSMYEMSESHLRNAIKLCDDMGNHGKQAQLQYVLKEKYQNEEN